MECAAQGPCTDDGFVGDGVFDVFFDRTPHAESERPERTEIVLRLDSAQPTRHFDGILKTSPGKVVGDAIAGAQCPTSR